MGNVRNPVGPLPSSIYWRRRAVVLCLFAIVAAIVVWLVTSGGGGGSGSGGKTGAHGPGGHGRTPLPSITPGPTSSQTGITTVPGGRSVGGSSDGGGTDGGSSGAAGASDNGGATDGGSTSGATSGGAAGSGGGTGGGSGGQRLPVGTAVPDCGGSHVRLVLHSVKNSYEPGEKPVFQVSAVNSGGAACKVNFSGVSAVLTVVDSGDHHVWSSDDCPASRTPYLLEVPAGGSAAHDVPWNLAVSAPHCATPAGSRTASSGTYLAKVTVAGVGSAQTSFVLSAV